MALSLQRVPLAVLVALCLAAEVFAANPHGVAQALDPRITNAPVVARQNSDSCWTSAPFESCIGPLNTNAGLCQQSTESSVYTSCACSTNSIYLTCWSSYCTADPTYGQELSDFVRDSTIFCGGGVSPATTSAPSAAIGTTPTTNAAGTTSTPKTNGGAPTPSFGGELVILLTFAVVWLAPGALPRF